MINIPQNNSAYKGLIHFLQIDSVCRELRELWHHSICLGFYIYRQTSNIRCTLAVNKIVDHWDIVGASPVGAAQTTSSFSI